MKRFLALIGLLMLFGCPVNPDVAPKPTPEPEPVNISSEMKTIVAKIEPISDVRLAEFYLDLADVIEGDTKIITTNARLRELNSLAGPLVFGTELKGKYPTLATDLEEATAAALDLKVTALDRARAVEFYRAVGEACR